MNIPAMGAAKMGEFFLQEAVVEVLREAKKNGESLTPSEISNRALIYGGSLRADDNGGKYCIAWGILGKLKEQKRIQEAGNGKWELTGLDF